MKNLIAKLADELKETKAINASLENTKKQLEAELEKQESKIELQQTEVSTLQSDKQELRAAFDELKSEKSKLIKQVETFNELFERVEEANSNLEENLEEISSKINEKDQNQNYSLMMSLAIRINRLQVVAKLCPIYRFICTPLTSVKSLYILA